MPDNGVGRDTGPDRWRRRVWGRIEAHICGMRGEHARIVALELPLSRGRKRRKRRAGPVGGRAAGANY